MHTQVLGLVPQDDAQDPEFDSWSELTTVTSFDAGTTQPVDEMEGQGMVLQDVKCFSSTSLLVESLIEQLCKLLEKDKPRQKKLYDEICHKLHQMKLIDETYQVEEFGFMRTHYQKALLCLLSAAKSKTISSARKTNKVLLNLSSSSLDLNATHLQNRSLLNTSRYLTEFDELEYIAKGGFGRVHKARNKLDDTEYAMKKICLRYRNISSFKQSLMEVKMLARLNHPNIVSYKAAWLEPFSPAGFAGKHGLTSQDELTSFLTTHTSTKSSRKLVFDSVSDEDSYGVVFKDSKSGDKSVCPTIIETSEESVIDIRNVYEECATGITISERSECEQLIKFAASNEGSNSSEETDNANTSLEDIADNVICEYKSILAANPVRDIWKFDHTVTATQQEWATLYIQMQLCACTLRQWLDQRNGVKDLQVDLKESVTIFYQIVRGVEYIHSQGIVHHDIKPSNIFVNQDLSQVQVGDFGLACFLQHSTADMTLVTDPSESGSPLHHKGEVGTRMYAAPEQLSRRCDPKSDVYSLGVVLFELLQPFTTDMERSKVIEKLKTGKIPSELSAKSPKLAQLISVLLSTSAVRRPTASTLLSNVAELMSEISSRGPHDSLDKTNKETTIQRLQKIISEKDHEIEELKRLLSQKEQNT